MATRPRSTREAQAWLEQQPPLDELKAAYPDDWAAVRREVATAVDAGGVEELQRQVLALTRPSRASRRAMGADAAVRAEARRQMTVALLRQRSLSAATGVTSGRLRFNLVDGWVLQRLLFESGLRRKPVSMWRFRLTWPLVRQRRFLMPLVVSRGIYCFYSRALVKRLAALADGRRCLEIAAGDGTLSRFLRDAGVDVVATDDHSWSRSVDFPEEVVRQDAAEAVRTREPEVVFCSWPPDGNDFERQVLATPSVQLYVVIGSRHAFATGDHRAYEQQTAFERTDAPELARLVLPPEIEPAVTVFRRRAAAA